MDNLLYSLNSVVPLFAVIALGYLLRRCGVLNENFIDVGTKLGFRVALPCLLFQQVASADLSAAFSPRLMWFGIVSVLLTVALLCAVTPLLIRDRAKCGAVVQAVFRGNFAILGVPLAIQMFGEQGAAPTALMLPVTVPLYNILAVVVLVLFEPRDGARTHVDLGKILLNVVTNPLIIAIVLALPVAWWRISLPTMVQSSIASVASLATPIALLCLGGQFDFADARHNLKITLPAALVKQAVLPAAALSIAVLLGFRDGELGAIFILFMAPSSVSSYIMAKNMRSDAMVAAQMIMLTTLLSSFTMFLGIFLLRSLQYI